MRALVVLLATTATASTAAKAKQILVDCVATTITARSGGWEVVEQLRELVESLYVTPTIAGASAPQQPAPTVPYAQLFKGLLLDVLTKLEASLGAQKPKRKDASGAILFEGYALSTFLAMAYVVGVMPPVPRAIACDEDSNITSVQIAAIPEINMVAEEDCVLLRKCLAIWRVLTAQLNSPVDSCLSEGSHPTSVPLMEKGVLPMLLRALEITIVSDMKRLYQGGADHRELTDTVVKEVQWVQEILVGAGCAATGKSSEVLSPKNDWCNQLLLSSSYNLFAMLSFSTRILASISTVQLTNPDVRAVHADWTAIDTALWQVLTCCLRNLVALLTAMDDAFRPLTNLGAVKAKDLMAYPAWVSLLKHQVFQTATDGLKRFLIAFGNQLVEAADKREIDLAKRHARCSSDHSPLTIRLEEEITESIDGFVEGFEKDALYSIIERETNGLKITKKLWRELVFGPSMWHGVEGAADETGRVYYQLDRKETKKRLRNRLKRDWNERPHRSIGMNWLDTGKEESPNPDLMKLHVVKKVEEGETLPTQVEEEEEGAVANTSPLNIEAELSNLDLKFTHGERVVYSTRVELVLPMCVIEGRFDITPTSLYFFPESFSEGHEGEKKDMRVRHWLIDSITEVYRRRYLLAPTGLEFVENNKSYFINLPAPNDFLKVFHIILLQKPKHQKLNPLYWNLYPPATLVAKAEWTQLWRTRQMSNFEYLMKLNMAAGRTYNDIQQYPVFPWVLADYTSSSIDLNKEEVYRDLSKPIGALNEERLEGFLERYHAMEGGDIPPFMYGSHYSNVGTVLNFLVRMEPFAELAARLQGGHFDWPDRLFHSIEEAWTRVLTSTGDLKELTPEFFYSPHFLRNMNGLDLGKRQDGTVLGDVILPPWAASPEEFVRINMQALESDYVSEHLNEWIDLIFGWVCAAHVTRRYKQRGEEAVKANNVFYYLTYEGMVDLQALTDLDEKKAIEAQIANFGQTPSQLFTVPHPKRLSTADSLAALGLKILPGTMLKYQPVKTGHTGRVLAMRYSEGDKEVLSVDSNGMVFLHKYLAAQPGHKLFPFTFQANEKNGTRLLPASRCYPTSIRNRVVHEGGDANEEVPPCGASEA